MKKLNNERFRKFLLRALSSRRKCLPKTPRRKIYFPEMFRHSHPHMNMIRTCEKWHEIFHYLIFSSIFLCANYLQCQSSFIILKVRINLSWLFMSCWCYIVSWVKHLHVIFCCLFSLRLSAGFYGNCCQKDASCV